MGTLTGFGSLSAIPEEKITDKITRRVLAGQKGMMVMRDTKSPSYAISAKKNFASICVTRMIPDAATS